MSFLSEKVKSVFGVLKYDQLHLVVEFHMCIVTVTVTVHSNSSSANMLFFNFFSVFFQILANLFPQLIIVNI